MPFFTETSKKVDKIKQCVTLQVRIPLMIYGFGRKRVLSSAPGFFGKAKKGSLCASLTVEASLVLPLLLFSMVILMTPMKLMNENRKVQTALESVCEQVSQYAYIRYQLEQGKVPGLTEAGVLIYAGEKVKKVLNTNAVSQISFLRSKLLADGETIDLVMDYRMNLPFSVFRLSGIPMTARSSRRAWIGKEGGRGQGGSGQETADEIVYIGRNSTRYHRSRTCHYLYNNISAEPYDDVGTLRNADGKKYRPCGRCGSLAQPGSMIYVMPSGDSYHSSRNCSSIVAYVQAVPLSQVVHLGPCSYCSQ